MRAMLLRVGQLLAVAGVVGCTNVDPSAEEAQVAARSAGVLAEPDPGSPGAYAAGFSALTFVDVTRTGEAGGPRALPVHLWYPVDPGQVAPTSPEAVYPLDPIYSPGKFASSSEVERYGIDRAYQDLPASGRGPFPLLIFSGGWANDASLYTFLGARLASHGIVVAALSHPGDGNLVQFGSVADSKVLMDRPRDMSFVLTRLLEASAAAGGPWSGLLDPTKVAAGGHSIGGYAALALAGGDGDACDAVAEFAPQPAEFCVPLAPDPRFRAVIRLDASEWALHRQELARVEVPTISLNQDAAAYAGVCDGIQARGHAYISSRVNLRVDVRYSNHQTFSMLCDWLQLYREKGMIDDAAVDMWNGWFCTDPDPASGLPPFIDHREGNRLTAKYAITFLKAHLAGERAYGRYLMPAWVWSTDPELDLFRTERGGDHHFGPGSMCLPSADQQDEFDYYMYMRRPAWADGPR